MKPTYVETIPESVSAREVLAQSRKYCPTQGETSPAGSTTPFVPPKAMPIVHTDPSKLCRFGSLGMFRAGSIFPP
jgi:hypothetical protein